MRRCLPLLALLLIACEGDDKSGLVPDPTEFLIDLVELHAEIHQALIFDGIEACGGPDTWNSGKNKLFWQGECTIPDASGDSYGISGELLLDVSFMVSAVSYERIWDWDMGAEYTDVSVGSATFSGVGSWTAQTNAAEHFSHEIAWSGTLSGPWPSEVDVSFEGLHFGNVHHVAGHVGDDEVDYTNPDPDVP